MEDNKNLEGQGQQNQDPDNTPEEKEPTVEELMAQLAQERANSAKLQNNYNKVSTEAANYKKQLKLNRLPRNRKRKLSVKPKRNIRNMLKASRTQLS